MLFCQLVATSDAVAATRSRREKTTQIAALLRSASDDGPRAVLLVAAFLSGQVPQGRLGVGWRTVGAAVPVPAEAPSLTLAEVDAAFTALAQLGGAGSASARRSLVLDLLTRATDAEQRFLRGLLSGDVRQGALDGVMQAALAEASGVPLDVLRRAVMLAGRTSLVAAKAMTGGVDALRAIELQVLRAIAPMLASSASAVGDVVEPASDADAAEWSIECKYDGIRIQAHKLGDEVRLFTRSLDDITDRLPDVVEVVAALPAHSLVLDGEAIALRPDGTPQPFQVTGARTASSRDPEQLRQATPLTTIVFDLLHLNGENLLDHPLRERRRLLAELVPAANLVPSVQTSSPDRAQQFFDAMVASGHEGIVAKRLDSPYAAGRRGGQWVKVKPRHTLDLVVLAVERGSGRRQGLLSNIHLGARDADTGEFVMLGKTFKGMTDAVLAWQTQRFTELAINDDGWVVTVRPEQVVEVAFDGLQTSSRYPAGLALRFARVLRYRDDKTADQTDTIEMVRHLAGRS